MREGCGPYHPVIPDTKQLTRPTSITLDIPQVVALAEGGRLRVPAFQRSFVWDADDVRKLFDSVWRGFPIGTLLLWRREADPGDVAFGPISLSVPGSTEAYWVVDGQQRVTSLVGVLSPLAKGSDDRFQLCFDLRRARFVHASRRASPPWWLPVRVTLETRILLAWIREHGEGLSEDELDLADAVGGALRDYKIPAYVVEHDDDDLLREVFDRVNSAGKRISRAQVFHALFAAGTVPGSPASVVESLRHQGFGELDDDRVVQSLLAIRGGDVLRDLHDEFGPNEDRAAWFDDTERALSLAISFLRRQGVPHLRLVPSTFPLPVLAAFFHLHPAPDPWNERLLARWIWRGWAHGFGKGGQTAPLRQAVRAVHPRKGHPDLAPIEYEAVRALVTSVADDPVPPIDVERFRTDTALGRLILLALASLEPKDLEGEVIDLAEVIERRGVDAVTDLIPGHRTNAAARGFWPVDAPPPTGHEDRAVLWSHAIDDEAAAALRLGPEAKFLRTRGNLVQELTRRYLNARLEQGSVIRPPLAELLVPDEDTEEDLGETSFSALDAP